MAEFFNAHSYIISQILGFGAMFTAILMYQFKKHRTIMLLMVLSSGLWCLHFASMGLLSPVMLNVVNLSRAVVFSFRDKKWANKPFIPVIFGAVSLILMVVTWEGPASLLPGIGTLCATFAGWQTDTKKLKILTVPVCACWFTYDMLSKSIAGMCNEIFVLASIVVFFVRVRKRPAEKTE